jgi:hypothetical protein
MTKTSKLNLKWSQRKGRKVERGNRRIKKKTLKGNTHGENKKTFKIILLMLKTQRHNTNGLP